ncbi:hypothetical protein [Sulfuriflexus sp.]|uniref:hypothetical protein n=1 Tax=Sulfuriflexus sp. TaxID=2015443 RepID=UPI0028CF3BDB|nr:hypothetical protein [Sulfuriflexus sp.]MDT8404373.1 hypothetical protein [Sulfuriflexus sp.]
MNKQFKYAPLALAMAALFASPLAFANGEGNGQGHDTDTISTSKTDTEVNTDVDTSTSSQSLAVNIEKSVSLDEEVDVYVEADLIPDAYSRALVDDTQTNLLNEAENFNHDNNATASGDSMSNASGNIGANVAAGDNNQQDNAAAIAAADAELTFGMADAQVHASQDGEFNYTLNEGVTNTAGAIDNAFQGASGNVGANFAAGNNNQQKNNLAVSVSSGGVGLAMVTSEQESDRNYTSNTGSVVRLESGGELSGTQELSGTYTGTSDQIGNVYPDIWANNPGDGPDVHPTDEPGPVGHFDLDTATQGGSDLNDDGGALAFNEQGDITLSGTFSGSFSSFQDVFLPSSNDASLSGSAFSGASGNIGVNIAAGTGNQQNNSLSISASTGTAAGGGSNGGGEPSL